MSWGHSVFRFPSHSLSAKLSVIFMLLAIPIFMAALGLLYHHSRTMVHRHAMSSARSTLNATVQRVHSIFTTIETATNSNAMSIADDGHLHPDSILALTRYIVGLNHNIDGCSVSMEPGVFASHGSNLFSAYTFRERRHAGNMDDMHRPVADGGRDTIVTIVERPYNYCAKTWYTTPRNLDAPCWVAYSSEEDTLEVMLDGMNASYGRPLYDGDGHLVGVISTDLSLKRLAALISQEKPYPNSYFLMVDNDGKYVVHPDTARLYHHSIFDNPDPRRHADIIALGHELTQGKEGCMPVVLDGKPCLVTYQPVPGLGWSLALVSPDSDILADYHQLTYILLPLLAVGLLFILLLCHHAVARSIRPLGPLLEKTQEIAAGNMEVHIPRSTRTDVVGSLQNSFASMLQRLNFHMGSVRYTTEQAQLRYEELAEATRQAEEADRQKTLFIQNVSHQVRTPLNIIMGFAQILSNSSLAALGEDDMKEVTGTMKHNANVLMRLILMLYDSSDTGFYEELDSDMHDVVACNDFAREAISVVKEHYTDADIRFWTEVPDSVCLDTNRKYLLRSLKELLYNAIKYSDGKHMAVGVEMGEKKPKASAADGDGRQQQGRCIRFIVEDTGKGISEEYRDQMFTFFTKVDDLSEGLGLGLPLARRHILNLGGDLLFDDGYKEGCRFVIEMPL